MEYYVASVADHVHVPPGAAAPVTGLLAQYVFLGGVWEKLDVDMQVLKIREYKTFGDMLSEKTMTTWHREMANSLLDSMYGQLVDAIAEQSQARAGGRCARRSTAGRRPQTSCRPRA